MLKNLQIRGFKSLVDVSVEFPRLTILFGPNAAGKSNLLEAVQILSRLGTCRTLSEAFTGPTRGYPLESLSFSEGGLPELLQRPKASFDFEAKLDCESDEFDYRVGVQIQPVSGSLTVSHEFLAKLGKRGSPSGTPVIEEVEGQLHIRRKGKPAHPRQEPLHLNHTLLSDTRFSGESYQSVERCRGELEGWRIYYLDPRVAMRSARTPAEVQDIGVLGEDIAPFLYRLKAEHPKAFASVRRTLRTLIPSVQDLSVDLDEKRGILDIQLTQHGTSFSSRIISEGTLRVLALCAIAVNPWSRGLIAFEEPENGVHPRRLELIADLLTTIAVQQKRQVIVTTHSAIFCDAILRHQKAQPEAISMLNVRRSAKGTEIGSFEESFQSLFKDRELAEALSSSAEDGLFENLMLRGMIDG
jgi:predicted ATPase